MATIRAGELDRKVTAQRAVTTRDALNAPVQSGWDTLAIVSGKRTSVSGADAVQGAQPGRVSTHRFLVRWTTTLAGLTSADQLVCEDVTYAVERVDEFERRRGLLIWATARPDLVA